MISITSNELKTGGISQVKRALEKDTEAVITVRGKAEYVIMRIDRYEEVREMEILEALAAVRADIAAGRCYTGLDEHFARIDAMLEDE